MRPIVTKRKLAVVAAGAAVAGLALAVAAVALLASDTSEPAGNPRSVISAGATHTCMVTQAGGAACWGSSAGGLLGDGACCDGGSETPVAVEGLDSGVIEVVASDQHSCALTDEGEVLCWGASISGNLGDGRHESSPRPVMVERIDGEVRAVSASQGRWHTCALLRDGGLRCWGDNQLGQLGNGETDEMSDGPVGVRELGGKAVAVSAGGMHTCAILESSRVRCWGNNGVGQLGDGTTRDRLRPVTVLDQDHRPLEGVASLSAGVLHSCAALHDGGAYCWGLAHNATTSEINSEFAGYLEVATRVPSLPDRLLAISAGWVHTCALREAGDVVCWGNDEVGQLGRGQAENARPVYSQRPVRVHGLDGPVVAVDAGDTHTCALLATGEVYCWGARSWTAKAVPGVPGRDRADPR